MPDEFGYPTNPEYIQAQGLDLVEANRRLYEAQQEAQQLQELQQVLSDREMRQAFFAEYDRQIGAGGDRPVFPGQQSPELIVPASMDDVEYWFNHFNQLKDAGMAPNPATKTLYDPRIMRLWDEFPPEALANLMGALPIF